MKAPETPPDEEARLSALSRLNILDTLPEERFDRLTRLAKRLFDVPIALVSLVDANRQWFKSCDGLDASETAREVSFCGHAILDDEVLLVPDAAEDERFHDNPLVAGAPYIRFYAGCPLKLPEGSKLGTLCIIDRRPRTFAEEEVSLLRDLAAIAEQELAALYWATLDELTGLANRRGFEALAAHALELCRRLGKPAALLYLDLDGFKAINDRFGHLAGDRALREFGRILTTTFRDSDVVGRLGGDEFAVLLTGAADGEVEAALGRLRAGVDRHNSAAPRGSEIEYSVGSVRFDGDAHHDFTQLMAEADRRMYERKKHKMRTRRAPRTA